MLFRENVWLGLLVIITGVGFFALGQVLFWAFAVLGTVCAWLLVYFGDRVSVPVRIGLSLLMGAAYAGAFASSNAPPGFALLGVIPAAAALVGIYKERKS